MKNSKSVIWLVIIYVGFLLVIGYDVYRGYQKLHDKVAEVIKHGNLKIPTP